jgi:hypothetical protein
LKERKKHEVLTLLECASWQYALALLFGHGSVSQQHAHSPRQLPTSPTTHPQTQRLLVSHAPCGHSHISLVYPRCPLQTQIFKDLPKQRSCSAQCRMSINYRQIRSKELRAQLHPLDFLSAKGKEGVAVESTSLRSRRILLNRILTSRMTSARLCGNMPRFQFSTRLGADEELESAWDPSTVRAAVISVVALESCGPLSSTGRPRPTSQSVNVAVYAAYVLKTSIITSSSISASPLFGSPPSFPPLTISANIHLTRPKSPILLVPSNNAQNVFLSGLNAEMRLASRCESSICLANRNASFT